MADSRARPRRRSAALPMGVTVALAINGSALLVLSHMGRGQRQAAVPSIEFHLVRLSRPDTPRKPRASAPAAARSQPRPSAPSNATSPAQPVPAAMNPGPAAAGSGQGQATPDLGRILRANLGCNDPNGLHLTPEERARCASRLGAGASQAAIIPAPMDPGKRAWFDATHAAYTSKGPMDGALPVPIGCKVFFGGPKKKFKPAHSLKVPGLPCYVIPPRGVLTEESAVAPPEHVETR